MAKSPEPTNRSPRPRLPVHPHVIYAGGIALLVFTAVLFPVALGSVLRELVFRPDAPPFYISDEPTGRLRGPGIPPGRQPGPDSAYLNVTVIGIDEAKGLATLWLAGSRACTTACDAREMVLFSLGSAFTDRLGLPPSTTVTLPEGARQSSHTVELPVSGQPSLYPFDSYELVLGVVALAPSPDGTSTPIHTDPEGDPFFLTIQSHLQRMTMDPPVFVDPATVRSPTDPYAFLYVRDLRFRRPFYLPVLTVLLVVLIAATTTYSVSRQPLTQLITGVGSLVIGVWGIRAILVPGFPPYVTAVDLLLSSVILILLAGIIGRAAVQVHRSLRAPSAEAPPDE